MSPELYLIRHGETAWTITKQHSGRSELPLTATGFEQAEELRESLRDVEFSRVFTSPLLRTRQTCERAGFGKCFDDPDLVEWDYGVYEGKTKDEILKTRPGWNIFHDGCPGGESPEDVSQRAERVITRLLKLDGKIALFSHGHFLRVLATRWLNWPIGHAQPLIFGPASVSVLALNGAERVLVLWNRAGRESKPKPRE